MRELDCDFCGGTADGAYEVLPAELDPTPAEQVRLVLCDDCRETLDGVLAPLLDRLDAGAGGVGEPSLDGDAAGHAGPTPTDTRARDSPDDAASDAAGHATPDASRRDEAATDPDRGTDLDPGSPTATTDATDPGAEPDGTDRPDATDDAVDEFERPTEATADTAEDRSAADDTDAGADADPAGESAGGDADPAGAATPPNGEPSDEPDQFRTVMRLLNNREFPVERATVTDLAAGAYDLEDHEVAEILDYAIERGILAEEDGTLVKG
ncbi:hypothetical protein [Halobaculum sp. EA56]|uniref:hypothetical protein n=1 Tax=Halobaculum sp. EA56 TaxID=3421648 RepID=UPI003EB9CFC9